MTRFEKSLIYVMFILAGISMLLLGRQVEGLEKRVDALEMREAAFAPSGADVRTTTFYMGSAAAVKQREERPMERPQWNPLFAFTRTCAGETHPERAEPDGGSASVTSDKGGPAPTYRQFTAFAYCACEKCCGRWSQYGLTASGTKPVQGRTVAVDPNIIPLGTQLVIDGAGGYVAEDTGAGIAGNTLDIYFERHEDALLWGVRKVTVQWME